MNNCTRGKIRMLKVNEYVELKSGWFRNVNLAGQKVKVVDVIQGHQFKVELKGVVNGNEFDFGVVELHPDHLQAE